MGYTLSKKGRLAVKTQAAWGTSETSFATTDYMEVDGIFIPPLVRETLSNDTYRPGYTAPLKVPGSKVGATISVNIPLHGWSATTPSGDPTIHPDALIIQKILGAGAADAYTTAVAAGSTTSLINITNGQADALWAGFAQLGVGATKNTLWWCKTIDTGVSPDTIVPLVTTIVEAPAAGTAYGSYVCYLAPIYASLLPLSLEWLGTDANAKMRFFDALPSKVTITLAAKQRPMMAVDFFCLDWTNVGSGGAPADYAYTYPQMPACLGVNGFSAKLSGGSEICPRQVVIELTQTLSQAECASANQGVDSLIVTDRAQKVSVTLNPSDLSTTPWTYAPGDAPAAFQVVANTTPGRAFSFCIPAPQIAEQPASSDAGGLLGLTYVLEPLIYSGDTGSTVPADTTARAAFL